MPYEIALVNPRSVKHRKVKSRPKKASHSLAILKAEIDALKSKLHTGRKSNPSKGKKQMAAKRKSSKKGKMPPALKKYWAAKRAAGKTAKRKKKVVHTKKSHATSYSKPAGARPSSLGYTVGNKPIRRYKLNPRHKRRHHARRHRRHNPRFSMAGFTSQLMNGSVGAAGAVGVNVVLGYLPIPATLKTGLPSTALKLAGAVGLGWAAGKALGKHRGSQIAAGAITVTLYDLFNSLLKQYAPGVKTLGEYDTVFGYIDPATVVDSGTGAYLPSGMGAYLQGADPMGAYLMGEEPDVVGEYDTVFGGDAVVDSEY